MSKLEDLKELKMDGRVIPVEWSNTQIHNKELMQKEIMSIIIDENIKYIIEEDLSKNRQKAKEQALLHWIKQLKIGYLKFFKENESFDAIFESKKFNFLGVEYQIVSDETVDSREFDEINAMLKVSPIYFEYQSLLIGEISATIHDILMHVTAYQHLEHYIHQINAYSILSIFIENGIDNEFFGNGDPLRLTQINIGLSKYTMTSNNDLDDSEYGSMNGYWKEIRLNPNNSKANELHTIIHEITHAIFKEWDINVSDIYRRTQLAGGKKEDKDKLMEEEIVTRLSSGLADVFLNNDNNLYNYFSYVKPKIVNLKIGNFEINGSKDKDN